MAKFSDKVFLESRAKGPPRLLYIKNLTIYDAGNYSCHAYAKVGNVISEQWAHALMRVKGWFLSFKDKSEISTSFNWRVKEPLLLILK